MFQRSLSLVWSRKFFSESQKIKFKSKFFVLAIFGADIKKKKSFMAYLHDFESISDFEVVLFTSYLKSSENLLNLSGIELGEVI